MNSGVFVQKKSIKMLRTVTVFTALFLFTFSARAMPPSTLLIDAKTGTVLSESRAHLQRFPASLTKLMTLYLVFERIKNGKLKLTDKIRFSRRACCATPTKLYLKPRSRMTIKDAITALAVKSANDVAIAVAENLAGCESKFALEMNAKAKELGMKKTVFKNASGLPNRYQVSTAYDLALLTRALIKDFPEHKHFFSTKYFKFRGKKYKNTNGLLGKMPGVDGMKTGYTRAAGWNLITSYHRGNDLLIGVVMGEKNKHQRNAHMRHLLEGKKFSPQVIQQAMRKWSGGPSTHWGIQVGVFKNGKQARKYARVMKKKHPNLLKDKTFRIVRKISRKVRHFKTRFNFHTQKKAREICAALKKRGVNCFVVNGG